MPNYCGVTVRVRPPSQKQDTRLHAISGATNDVMRCWPEVPPISLHCPECIHHRPKGPPSRVGPRQSRNHRPRLHLAWRHNMRLRKQPLTYFIPRGEWPPEPIRHRKGQARCTQIKHPPVALEKSLVKIRQPQTCCMNHRRNEERHRKDWSLGGSSNHPKFSQPFHKSLVTLSTYH